MLTRSSVLFLRKMIFSSFSFFPRASFRAASFKFAVIAHVHHDSSGKILQFLLVRLDFGLGSLLSQACRRAGPFPLKRQDKIIQIMIRMQSFKQVRALYSRLNLTTIKPRNFSQAFWNQRKNLIGSGVVSLVLYGSGTAALCASTDQLKKEEIAKEVESGIIHAYFYVYFNDSEVSVA